MNGNIVTVILSDLDPVNQLGYKTSKDMSEELRKALPDIEDLKKLLDHDE